MPYRVLGIMSGSSLDGLDMALITMDVSRDPIHWQIDAAVTLPYPDAWRQDLKSAHLLGGQQLMQLDAEFGIYIGQAVHQWMDQRSLQADYIASHGHTIYHEPGAGFTTQIGSGAHIASVTGIDTITSFRDADVAAGGQGAPFAPVADRFMFPGYEAYLNLGGIVNVSVRMPDGTWKAWDIGPCNQPLNHLANKLGHAFDPDGRLSGEGQVIESVAEDLLIMFPFQGGKPKGLSNAEVHATWIRKLDLLQQKTEDLLATVTSAIARMLADHLLPMVNGPARVLVTGGGAHHKTLINQLDFHLSAADIRLDIPSPDIINFKECALMAYLGYLFMQGIPFPVSDITGAKRDTIGGALHKAVAS